MKLEVAMLVGAESKAFLANLTQQLDRMESLLGAAGAAAPASKNKKAQAVEEDDEDFAPKKSTKKVQSMFEDDDEEVEAEEEVVEEDDEDFAPKKSAKKAQSSFDDEDEVEEKPAKKPAAKAAKPKKITIEDCNDACKARANSVGGKQGRAEVLALLKKHFKVTSVTEVAEADYAKLIKVMEV